MGAPALDPLTAPVASAAITVLNLGCGHKQTAADLGLTFAEDGKPIARPITVVSLDANPVVQPDLVCCLGRDSIPMLDNSVDLAIAFHVIEHIGEIGKLDGWFQFWAELYRVLKPGAGVTFECPYFSSVWAWADPTHIRAISEYTFLYLNQDAYRCGGAIPDYRPLFDFRLTACELMCDALNSDVKAREAVTFIRGTLTAQKPLRPYWRDPIGSHDKACGLSERG